jgi:RNA polymerase sigma factor FliA
MTLVDSMENREEIVLKYTPLVKYIASRVIIGKSRYVEYDDLIGYGMLGLMDAINKFDESRGMQFSTYASIRIKGSMIDEIRKLSPISKGAIEKLNKYNEAVEALQTKLLRDPSTEELAQEMSITSSDISDIESSINYISVVSLDDILFSENDEVKLKETIEDKKTPSPERSLEDKEELEYLSVAIEKLNEKDRLVLSLYYYEGLTLKEIGKVLEVSESRICQLHSRAIIHLRKILKDLRYSE